MNQENEVIQIYLDDIIPNRFQPRELFDEESLKELAISIKEHGVIQPIIVRRIGTKYEIIAGERRYKASTLAGLTRIPAIVRDLDDKESSKVALIENLQRRDLTPIEEARTYQTILDLDEMTQEDLAKSMGKSQSAISNKLRLLTLSNEIQDALLKQKISERHARCLLNVNDENYREELLRLIIEEKMSVRDLEEEIKKERDTFDFVEGDVSINKEEKEEEVVEIKEPEKILPTSIEINKISEIKDDDDEVPSILIPKKEETKEEKIITPVIEEIETLDFLDDDVYTFIKTDSNKTGINSAVETIREAIRSIKADGFKVRNDELDLDKVHRFIIEIEK